LKAALDRGEGTFHRKDGGKISHAGNSAKDGPRGRSWSASEVGKGKKYSNRETGGRRDCRGDTSGTKKRINPRQEKKSDRKISGQPKKRETVAAKKILMNGIVQGVASRGKWIRLQQKRIFESGLVDDGEEQASFKLEKRSHAGSRERGPSPSMRFWSGRKASEVPVKIGTWLVLHRRSGARPGKGASSQKRPPAEGLIS